MDLSSPEGASVNDGVNDGVSRDTCSLSYTSVDVIAKKVPDTKMDIKQAYRMVPVHPDDRHLLGMRWAGSSVYR